MTISQREARRLKKRVDELEKVLRDQRFAWAEGWPMGINISNVTVQPATFATIAAARKLRHAVVVTTRGEDQLAFIAMLLPEQK